MATPTRDDDAATHNESETHPPAPAPTGKTPADMILCLYRLPLPLSHTSERTRTSTLTTLFQRGSLSLIQCPPETVCGEELVLAIAGRGTPPPAPATITLNGLPMMMEALQDAARIVRREDEDAGWRNMSVHDNVEFAVRQRSVGGPPRCEDVHRIVGTLFELVGIATAEASVCWEDASIAIRRRVAVVRCLIQCPLMLIMDGAMDGLTEEEAIAFMHVLKRVAQTSHRAILGMMMADSVHEDEDDEDDASSSGHAEALSLRHSRRSHAPPRVPRKMLDEEDEACVALLHNANDATSSRLAQLWKPRRAGTSSDEYDDDDAGLVVVVSVASLPSFVTLVGVVDHLTLLAHYDGRTIFSGPLPTLLRWHMLLHEEAVHDREGDGEPMSCLTSISNASSFGEPPCSISSHPHDVHLRGRRSNRPADVDELLAMLQEEGQCSPPSVSGTEPRTKKKQQRHHLAERTTNRSALMNGRNAAVHLNDATKDALFSPLNLPCVGELMREPLHVCHVLREELRYGLRSLWSCALNQPSWWGLALILASLMLAALTVCAHKDAYDCATTVKWLTIVLTAASIQLPMFSSSLSISICTNALDAMALRRHQPHGNWRATIGWLGCLILHTTTHVLMGCMMLLPSLAIHVYWNATTGLLAALDDTDMRHTARMDHQLGIMAEAAGSSSLWARKELPMLELTMICVLSSITSSFAMVSVQLAWMWSSAVVGPRWEWWVMEVVAPVVEIILAFVNCIGILVVSFPDKRAVLPSSLTETHIWGIATWLGRQGISAAHTAVLRWQRFGCDEAGLAPSTWSIHIHDGGHVLTNTCLTGHMMLEKMGLGVNDLSTLVAPLLASTYIAMVVCTLTLWCASRYDLVG